VQRLRRVEINVSLTLKIKIELLQRHDDALHDKCVRAWIHDPVNFADNSLSEPMGLRARARALR
jgi:hypothetical protein